jgi:hypothetical protein
MSDLFSNPLIAISLTPLPTVQSPAVVGEVAGAADALCTLWRSHEIESAAVIADNIFRVSATRPGLLGSRNNAVCVFAVFDVEWQKSMKNERLLITQERNAQSKTQNDVDERRYREAYDFMFSCVLERGPHVATHARSSAPPKRFCLSRFFFVLTCRYVPR